MNIEIANRLYELRKKNGLSQEELADKLGLSRQSISKWERAESSPDTDNLIMLAKLYNVSLDELLNTSEPEEEIKDRVSESESQKNEENFKGIKIVDEDGSRVEIRNGEITINDSESGKVKKVVIKDKVKEKASSARSIIDSCISLLVVIAYFVVSFMTGAWGITWVMFFLIPILCSISEMIFRTHRLKTFCYPVLVTAAFLFFGMMFQIWHPLWILFLTIPLFYVLAEPFDRYVLKTKSTSECEDEDEDEDKDND